MVACNRVCVYIYSHTHIHTALPPLLVPHLWIFTVEWCVIKSPKLKKRALWNLSNHPKRVGRHQSMGYRLCTRLTITDATLHQMSSPLVAYHRHFCNNEGKGSATPVWH